MAGERWIVFLVLASLGGGIYIMSYVVDDESIEKYGKRVAEYNAQHHETVMDAALHRAKRWPEVDALEEQASVIGNDADDAGMEDHPYSENDRVMRARVNGDEDIESDTARRRRSSGQGINESEHSHQDAGTKNAGGSIEQDIIQADLDYRDSARRGRSDGHFKEDPNLHQGAAKARGPKGEGTRQISSIGQLVNEGDPDIPRDAGWARRSSGQGIIEEDPNNEAARRRRSIGPGINNEDHSDAKARRSIVQGVNLESPHYPHQKVFVTRRSTGINNGETLQSLEAGSSHNKGKLIVPLGRGLVADLAVSAEDIDGQEDEQTSLGNTKLLANHDSDESSIESESPEEYDYYEPEESHVNPYEPADSGLGANLRRADQMSSHLVRRLLTSDCHGDKKLITFNKGIDFILGLMNSMFSLEGELSVPLPKLNKTFGHGIMRGLFEADGGFFKNPATLHRTDDVAIVKNGDSVGLEVALGLKTLEAGYDHYDLKILKIHQNGTLDVSVAENSIKMKISLTYYPHCKVDVNYLELDKLGGIKVDITGLGAFQSMINMLTKWLTDNFTNDFRLIVNNKLIEKAKKAVAREDICKYFPLSLL